VEGGARAAGAGAARSVDDHGVRDFVEPRPAPGRALVETGELVAGSMSRAVAGLLFDPASSRLSLDERLAGVLRDAATAAADLSSPWERARAGGALAFAAELAVTRTHRGRAVRGDGFFGVRSGARSDAERLVEAVVHAALAARALQLSEQCGWRQLVVLAAVGRRDRVPLPLQPLEDEPRAWTAWGAREDVTDLQRAGLLDPPPAAPRPGAGRPRLRAADLRLTRRGVLVHRLLALDFVRDDDVAAALADLGLPRS
jgi:hypothetical protein